MTTAATNDIAIETRAGRSLWSDAVRKLRRDPVAVACFVLICLYAATAIAAPWVLSDWSQSFNYDNLNQAPSGEYFGVPSRQPPVSDHHRRAAGHAAGGHRRLLRRMGG